MVNLLLSFTDVLSYALYILIALLVLLVMITVHEFGHYIVGKIFKFKINEFAIGFGPAIFKKTKKDGEVFSIRLLPLGGYCAFAGEDEDALTEGDFNSKPPWQRILVLLAGATMNFLTAILVAGIFIGAYGTPAYRIETVRPTDMETGFVQYFEEGDIIIGAEDKSVYLITDLMSAIGSKKAGETITVTVLRNGTEKDVTIKLLQNEIESIESTGETLSALGIQSMRGTTVRFGFFTSIGKTFGYTFRLGASIFEVLGQLLTGKLGLNAMGGTVTTITTTANGVKNHGLGYLLQITALIGVNLSIFNLLPIPALDGCKTVFTLIEWIRGKPVNRKIEYILSIIGMVLLLGFAVIVDLQHCF